MAGNKTWLFATVLAGGAMFGTMMMSYKSFAPSHKTTFSQKNITTLNAETVSEEDEGKTLTERFAASLVARDAGPVRSPASTALKAEIRMTQEQDEAYVTYAIELAGGSPEDVKVVVTASRIEITAKQRDSNHGNTTRVDLKKEFSIPPGVDHTRAEVTKRAGKWIVKLPKV